MNYWQQETIWKRLVCCPLLGGVCYLGDPDEQRELPFRTLVRCVTDTPQSLAPAATVGLYLGFCRVIRERPTTSESGSSSQG